MKKEVIVAAVREQILLQYERAVSALEGAHEAATGDDTQAENKYDTRGLEASYLAAGQAEQADELNRALYALDSFRFPDFDFDSPIGPGALIEADQEGETVYFLLAPAGGGLTVETEDGEAITVLGPASPLRHRVMGLRVGDKLNDPELTVLEVY